ncbi:MAG: aspartate carbamoyltransferase catalytic subunit [Candidatus Tokpelaia sp.]|nr:MAG: aspartate carbamoyltransferase catalytic subunit [Candidatus Tokpelaia sp.]KAA6207671.1 MAG: aspartate carbamoyltransferase catalytic subunit [Candidatus Tokpelaia sp.]
MKKSSPPSLPFCPDLSSLTAIRPLSPAQITALLDRAEDYIALSRQKNKKQPLFSGRTQINLFFENSTRTRSSFEIAGQRLGLDNVSIDIDHSSVGKGETLLDTALTLNAMQPDIVVLRHNCSGAADFLAPRLDCALINAGDGTHEHPTQALLDALTIRRAKGRLAGLNIAICGDILHSRVARSNLFCLGLLGARLRLIAPSTLLPAGIEQSGAEIFHSMAEGLQNVDVIIVLRLQKERMTGAFFSSEREYFHFFGLDAAKLAPAAPDCLVLHPGPMNRGVEIASAIADGPRSLIRTQVENGVAVRMAVIEALLTMRDYQPAGAKAARGNRPAGQKAAGGKSRV